MRMMGPAENNEEYISEIDPIRTLLYAALAELKPPKKSRLFSRACTRSGVVSAAQVFVCTECVRAVLWPFYELQYNNKTDGGKRRQEDKNEILRCLYYFSHL